MQSGRICSSFSGWAAGGETNKRRKKPLDRRLPLFFHIDPLSIEAAKIHSAAAELLVVVAIRPEKFLDTKNFWSDSNDKQRLKSKNSTPFHHRHSPKLQYNSDTHHRHHFFGLSNNFCCFEAVTSLLRRRTMIVSFRCGPKTFSDPYFRQANEFDKNSLPNSNKFHPAEPS